MKTIDLKAIIEEKKLDVNIVAQQLFPTNQFPRLAINRILAGKAVLDATQISKLALLADMEIGDLYTGNWEAKSNNGIHSFTNGEYIAELDTNTWLTKIFHNKSMIHESIIHAKDTPLSVYLSNLNNVILKIENND